MEPGERAHLEKITCALDRLLVSELPEELSSAGCRDEELLRLMVAVNCLIRRFIEARSFLVALSEGRLDTDVPARNFLVSPFKQLHANLCHLAWQTRRITEGDLNQHVDFLGEFSASFNAMIASLRDKRATEEALRTSEKRLRDITSALGEGVYVLNKAGELNFMNPEAERLLGWTEGELTGKKVHDIFHCRKADGTPIPEADCPALGAIRSGETHRVYDDVFTRKDGALLPVAFVATPVIESGTIAGSVTVFHDITALKRSQEALKRANELLARQASTDALTGAANRLKFNEALQHELSRSRRYDTPLTLILFDIDHFKKINDAFGHHIGDMVLQEVAHLSTLSLREEDVFARWGGEEFAILLPQTTRSGGRAVAERLRQRLERNVFNTAGTVTCSFGVSQLRDGDDGTSLLERADQALYRAKEGGRNRVETELPEDCSKDLEATM